MPSPSRHQKGIGNSAAGCKAVRPNTRHKPSVHFKVTGNCRGGAHLKRDRSSALILQTSSPIHSHHTCTISAGWVVTDGPALVVPVNMLSDLTFELDLQARCPIAFMAHGARGSFFGLDQRLLEGDLRAFKRDECKDKRTALFATGEKPTLHSQARHRTTNGAASL